MKKRIRGKSLIRRGIKGRGKVIKYLEKEHLCQKDCINYHSSDQVVWHYVTAGEGMVVSRKKQGSGVLKA